MALALVTCKCRTIGLINPSNCELNQLREQPYYPHDWSVVKVNSLKMNTSNLTRWLCGPDTVMYSSYRVWQDIEP